MCQVLIKKTNTREPPFKCRNYTDDVKTGEVMLLRDKFSGNLHNNEKRKSQAENLRD